MSKVMIVDDSRAVRMILKGIMSGFGYEACEAGDGREALAVIDRERPVDLALIDWNMPVMNGLELVTALRGDPRNSAMKIIMVTTETEISRMVAAIEAGADEYVMKPFTGAVVEDKLRLLGLLQQVA